MHTVIVYRLGSLGDTIVALPCFHKIAEAFPNSRRIVLTNFPVSSKAAPLQAILGGSGLIDQAISYPAGTRSLLKLWELSREIRKLKATTLIYLMPTRGRFAILRDLIFIRMCGIHHVVGKPRGDLHKLRIDSSSGTLERECERLARAIGELGKVDLAAPSAWDLVLTDHEKTVGIQCVQPFQSTPFIAVNMGGKAAEKDWGLERWVQLLSVLSMSYRHYCLLVVGGAEDYERAIEVTKSWPNKVVNSCGLLSPRESAGALSLATLFIGHDSGPLHLAAASGVRCVGLFGDFNRPKKWHPYGDHHRIIHCADGMSAITVDEVVRAVTRLLAQPKPNARNMRWDDAATNEANCVIDLLGDAKIQ